ncbi:hypothetical protein [Vogesella sp. XCS3]|uniref:hypothetical protein n=1 Tax=Vogesella sp. XCS3 TaxID=2877939 RepID=UPI001D0AD195|nr:hypothetical protein [Vogesella sp. XCS3]UDM18840.1 hypothetical protein LCH97_18390 [Vogesella sp. XCS3]
MNQEPQHGQDFGEAESLALDGDDKPGEGVEPPAARGSQRRIEPNDDLRFDEPGDSLDVAQPHHPKRNITRVVMLALISLIAVGMVGNSVWHKYLAPQPIPETAAPSFQPINHALDKKPAASAPQSEAIGDLGGGGVVGGVDSGTAQNQPTPQALVSSAPQPTQPASAPLQLKAQAPLSSPAPMAIQQPKFAPSVGGQLAHLAPSAKAITPAPAATSAGTSPARVPAAKMSASEESLEAKVERLEREVRSLKALAKSGAQGVRAAKDGQQKKVADGASAHRVVGMSAASVWVTQANGKTAELKVGDRFKNGEVIQSIDQQAQIVETDRGRYKVSF